MRASSLWLVPILIAGSLRAGLGADGSGRLVVKVQDAGGRPLVGAEAEIATAGSSPGAPTSASGEAAATSPVAPGRTDAQGTASFTLPLQARYVVRVSLPGFTAQASNPVSMRAGALRTVLFVLRPHDVERVRVLASIEDPGESRTSLPATFLEDLPLLGRSYQNALVFAPGVTDQNQDGNPNVLGARERDFRATVDGIANVDPLTGTYQSEVNPDAIADLEIVTSGASAEYGGAIGGFAKIITKEGSNALSASLGVYLRSAVLDRVASSEEVPDYHDLRPTLSLTGPLVKDRLFFALFHEHIDKGTPVDLPETSSEGFINGRRRTLSTGDDYVITSDGTRSLDKLTWQVSSRHKLDLQFASDPLETAPLGASDRVRIESAYALKQGGPSYQARWTLQGSSLFFMQTVLGESRTSVSYTPVTQDVKNLCPEDFWGSLRRDIRGRPGEPPFDEDYCSVEGMRSGSYFRNYSDDRKRTTLKTDMSYYVESLLGTPHTLRFGAIAERRKYDATQSLRAVSRFVELPPTPFRTPGNGFFYRQVFVPGYPGAQVNTAKGSGYGLYLEDQFSIRPNLSIRAGARMDQETLVADGYEPFDPAREEMVYRKNYNRCVDSPNANPDRCARSGFGYFHRYEVIPALAASSIRGILETNGVMPRVPEEFRITNTNLSPRLSVTWDPGSHGTTKVFATAGRYYGETFLAVPSFEQGPDSFLYTYPVEAFPYDCHGTPAGGGTFECKYRSFIEGDSQATVALASIRQVDRELRTPHQDEYTAGITHELLPETSITLTFIRRDYKDQLQDVDLNRYVVDPDSEDDVPLESVHSPFFNEVQRVGNYNESTYRAWAIELRRRLRNNWELDASYVYSRAQGDGEDFNQTLGNDPGLSDEEFGYLNWDLRHVVKLYARAQLPRWNVRLGAFLTWQSGSPYSVSYGTVVNDVPQRFGYVSIGYNHPRTVYPTGVRNDQRNHGYYNLDLSVRKDFVVKACDVTVSLDVFNALDDHTLIVESGDGALVASHYRTGTQFQLGGKIVY